MVAGAPSGFPFRTRLNLAVCAGLVAAASEPLFDRAYLLAATVCAVVGSAIFAAALRRTDVAGSAHAWRLPLHDTIPRARREGVALICLSVGLSIAGAAMFARDEAHRGAWWLYAASVVTLLIGAVAVGAPTLTMLRSHRQIVRPLDRRIWYALAAVLIVATFLRFYLLDQLPFGVWFDEAGTGLAARRFLADPSSRTGYVPAVSASFMIPAVYAAAIATFGDTVTVLRSVNALMGVATVAAAFLLGRELRGPRFGLALAVVAAVARWPITFSRIAMTGADTPFFEFLSLFFLVCFVRRGRFGHAVAAGAAVGAGLMFYQGFRLFVIVVALSAVVLAIRRRRELGADFRASAARVAALVAATCIVAMPFVGYTARHPGEVFERARDVSIFTRRDEPSLRKAIWQNLTRHVSMFNYQGDRNGRHNIPGEPMLDPAMGTLLVLGVGLALARAGQPANAFFLALGIAGLAGGILSVDFEAPQSLRSIAAFPAIAYFIALATAAIGRAGEQAFTGRARRWLVVPAFAVVVYMLAVNAYDYFGRYASNETSWAEFSAIETLVGRKLAVAGQVVPILSPFLVNHQTIRYLAPTASPQQALALPDALPIGDESGRPVMVILHPADENVLRDARAMYPHALIETLTGPPPFAATPRAYVVNLHPSDLAATRSLELRYRTPDRRGDDAAARSPNRVNQIQALLPAEHAPTLPFVAEWTGALVVPAFGTYAIRLTTPASGHVDIDGARVLTSERRQPAELRLAKGQHTLKVVAEGAAGRIRLTWTPPDSAERDVPPAAFAPLTNFGGLLGTYYANAEWRGQPSLMAIDPVLDTYFHLVPLARPYTVEWRGSLLADQAGEYRLAVRAVGDAWLSVDGQELLARPPYDQMTEVRTTLARGAHPVRIRFLDSVGYSRLHFWWAPPGAELQPVPRSHLRPPEGDEALAIMSTRP